jgi:hypothetical protein|nr:MAG TPA: hypothetical protein [Caudoviricetes sp.]
MKKIKDSKGKTFAHLVGKGTIEIKRSNQTFIVTGKDFSILGTTAFAPDTKEFIVVENGVLVEDGIRIVSDSNPDQDDKPDDKEAKNDKDTPTEDKVLTSKPDDKDEDKDEQSK